MPVPNTRLVPVLKDVFGDTVPLGDKIYAIRAPASTSSPEILSIAENRTVGIVFNWNKQVGFNRAGDNSRAFVFRPKVKGTYGDLRSAYIAAEEFIALPSVHEGSLPDTTTQHASKARSAFEEAPQNTWVFLYLLFTDFMKSLPITSKFVIASITLSLFLLASYSSVLYIQDATGCIPRSRMDISPSLSYWCQEMLKLQLHVQMYSMKYIELFFTQLKIAFVLFAKHLVDYMFL